jgi:hypothetical protein
VISALKVCGRKGLPLAAFKKKKKKKTHEFHASKVPRETHIDNNNFGNVRECGYGCIFKKFKNFVFI